MLKDRLSPADEAAREKDMREQLTTCPRILDLVAPGRWPIPAPTPWSTCAARSIPTPSPSPTIT